MSILNYDVITEIIYNNNEFWNSFDTYQYYIMLQSVSKSFIIDDNMKLSILMKIGNNIVIDYHTKLIICKMFKLNGKATKNSTYGYSLFNFIRIKYNNSWSKIKPIIKEQSNRIYMINKALTCKYGLTIKDTSIHLYKNIYNSAHNHKIVGNYRKSSEDVAYILYKNLYYKKCTNYFDI